jgi:hypothetical protein
MLFQTFNMDQNPCRQEELFYIREAALNVSAKHRILLARNPIKCIKFLLITMKTWRGNGVSNFLCDIHWLVAPSVSCCTAQCPWIWNRLLFSLSSLLFPLSSFPFPLSVSWPCFNTEANYGTAWLHFKCRNMSHVFIIGAFPQPASELYCPSDSRLSAKLVPYFADRKCHVVSVTDPYVRILGFLDRSRYFSIK